MHRVSRPLTLSACLLILIPTASRAQSLEGRVVRVMASGERFGSATTPVQLHRVSPAGGSVVDSSVAGPEGRFVFSLPADPGGQTVFVTSARHQGILYLGPPVHEGTSVPDPYEIAVYDTAAVSVPVDLDVVMRHVVLTPLAGGLQVGEFLDVAGEVDRTLVASDPGVPVWSANLARGAHGVTTRANGGILDVKTTDETVHLDGWLTPSGARLSLEYVLPGDRYDLELDHFTSRIEVIVSGARDEATAEGLSASPSPDRTVQRFSGSDLPAGTRVRVRVPTPSDGGTWAWVWLLAGVVLSGAAALTWLAGRRHELDPS